MQILRHSTSLNVLMRFFFFCFLLILLTNSSIAQETNLPAFMTPQEQAMYPDYQAPFSPDAIPTPPPASVRAMAEWEENHGLLLTWTAQREILSQIIDAAQEEGIVYVVCNDSNAVKNYLIPRNIPLYNIEYLVTGFNSIWSRDYGPWNAYATDTDSLYIIDWVYNRPRPQDDLIPGTLAARLNLPIYEATQGTNRLIHTGGNFMVDGHGTAYSSKLILDENPGKSEAEIDAILQDYLGIQNFVKLDNLPYDVIHHIDMHMKLLDEETLLMGEYPPGVADGPQIEQNLQYILSTVQTAFGRDFKVVRIPMPPDQFGRYPDTGGYYRTYTNSIILNRTVLVPTYEEQYDSTALRIYRETMPGYNIIGINCNAIIPSLGALHCIVKEIGAREPLFISHAPIRTAADTSSTIEIKATLRHHSDIATANVFWTTDRAMGFTPIPMEARRGDVFSAYLPLQPVLASESNPTRIYYYISAEANSGKVITKPFVAPAGYYEFEIETVTALAERRAKVAEQFVLHRNFPNPFNPETQIRFDLKKAADVHLAIYNVQGQKVKTLVNGHLSIGQHTLKWQGKNDHGEVVASGIYVYRLQAGAFSAHRKMLLVR